MEQKYPPYDLKRLSKEIRNKHARADEFAEAVNALYGLGSRTSDLRKVLKSLDIAGMYANEMRDVEDNTIVFDDKIGFIIASLSQWAIILYSKATEPYETRKRVSLENYLTSQQIDMHNAILYVRSKAFAHHVEKWKHPSGMWIDGTVVLQQKFINGRSAIETYNQIQSADYKKEINQYMFHLVPIHIKIMESAIENARKVILEIFVDILNDITLKDCLVESRFDPDTFFASAALSTAWKAGKKKITTLQPNINEFIPPE